MVSFSRCAICGALAAFLGLVACGTVQTEEEKLCTNGIQDPVEDGMDCGGPCSPCSVTCTNGSSPECASGMCEGTQCINKLIVQCTRVEPANATPDLEDVEIVYIAGDGWTKPTACSWQCLTGHIQDGDVCDPETNASIKFDQKRYTWTDRVSISMTAPGDNDDANVVEQVAVTVESKGAKLEQYKLVETGPDTGVFAGSVTLTGFFHDLDDNPTTVDTDPKTQPATDGGPSDGLLEVANDDTITVSFPLVGGKIAQGSAPIRWNIGEAFWLANEYDGNGSGVVRVTDADMNLDPDVLDQFAIHVTADSKPDTVVNITAIETGVATGVFEAEIVFSTTPALGALTVTGQDTITAEYKDKTLPTPHTAADHLLIEGQASTYPLMLSQPRFLDAQGTSVTEMPINEQVLFTASVRNHAPTDQSFSLVLLIHDPNGGTFNTAVGGRPIPPKHIHGVPTLGWTPTVLGTHTATVSVQRAIDDPTILAPSIEVEFEVR